MTNRRDFIKWVLYLGTVAQIPALATAEAFSKDVLEGVSYVPKKIIDIVRSSGGNIAEYRTREDAAFEEVMRRYWREENGAAPYDRCVVDHGLQPAHRWRDIDGVWWDEPDRYVTSFQYRRA